MALESGVMGPRTERAIRQFQRDNQLPITSQPSDSLVAVKHLAWTLQKYKESKTARKVEVAGRMEDQVLLFSLIALGTVIAVIVVIGLVTHARNRRSGHGTTASEQKKPYQTAKVHHVIDGDTVIVATFWRKIKIRLDSIDCPEQDQHRGDIAKYGLIKLIGGRRILLEEHGQDQYGRTVATIYVQHGDEAKWMNVNARMVTLEHAWVMRNSYRHLPKERQNELNRLERWAKTKGVGLWNSANPVPPWKWRGSAK